MEVAVVDGQLQPVIGVFNAGLLIGLQVQFLEKLKQTSCDKACLMLPSVGYIQRP